MPELPEVHTTATGLNKTVSGFTITDVWTNYNSAFYSEKENIKNPTYFKKFRTKIIGKKIISVSRRAKNVLIHLEGNLTILIHMKMTGHVLCGKFEQQKSTDPEIKKDPWKPVSKTGPLADPFNRFIRLVFTVSDKRSNISHIALSDMRRFAKVTLLNTDSHLDSVDLQHLGPEPLEKSFTLKEFISRIQKKPNGNIKTVLMDQSLIAGIGNIYSDEILWRSNTNPEEKVKNIKTETFANMFTAIKETLKKGINFGGDSMSDYRNIDGERGKFQAHHNAYRLTNTPCKKSNCKGIITRKIVGGRSAHFCNIHQKLQK